MVNQTGQSTQPFQTGNDFRTDVALLNFFRRISPNQLVFGKQSSGICKRDIVGKLNKNYLKIFMSDPTDRQIMMEFVHANLYTSVMTKINQVLVENSFSSMHSGEYIRLVQRGGNAMYETVKNLPCYSDVKQFFEPGDLDYSCFIKTDDYERYLQIEKCATLIMTDTLIHLRGIFEDCLNNRSQKKSTTNTLTQSNDNNATNTLNTELLMNVYKMVLDVMPFVQDATDIYDMPPETLDLIEEIGSVLAQNPLIASHWFIIANINFLNSYLSVFDAEIEIPDLTASMFKLHKKFMSINLYKNFDLFHQTTVETFNQIYSENKDTDGVLDLTDSDTNELYMKIDQEITQTDFNVKARNDIIFDLNENSEFMVKSSSSTGKHYLTYNRIVGAEYTKDFFDRFGLLRMKLNIYLHMRKRRVSFPIDLIDIAFDHISDTKTAILLAKNDFTTVTFAENFPMETFNLPTMFEDLYIMFFKQYLFPWTDKKYEKRLFRLIFFMIHSRAINQTGISLLQKLISDLLNIDESHTQDHLMEVVKSYFDLPEGTEYNIASFGSFDILNDLEFKNEFKPVSEMVSFMIKFMLVLKDPMSDKIISDLRNTNRYTKETNLVQNHHIIMIDFLNAFKNNLNKIIPLVKNP
jgi:hypothetical protein